MNTWLRLRRRLGRIKRAILRWVGSFNPRKQQRELDALYDLLYRLIHDWDRALDLSSTQTRDAFATQWETLPAGKYLLTDPWFRDRVDRILWEEELQIKPDWFRGRSVLDAGCGNGRWAYGLAKLGACLTLVDVNPGAVEQTRQALAEFDVDKRFFVSPLEELSQSLPSEKYDLVFSWGVIHHCQSFTRALREVASFVSDEGVLYLYLYDRDSISHTDELEVFKERVRFNLMETADEKHRFLLGKARGREELVHYYHDAYAPLINRRVRFESVRNLILAEGFEEAEPTIRSTGVWIRAIRSNAKEFREKWAAPPAKPPYWFQRH